MHRSMTFGILALSMAVLAVPARAQLGLGLAPMRVELKMAPGQEYSGTLKLSNQSGDTTRVRTEVLDFDVDSTATPQFERNLPQEAAFSCKKWLSVNPMELELDKDGFVNARYTIHLPADIAEGSYNCAAGFTTMPTAQANTQSGGVGMHMAVRIVAAIYVVIGKPAVDASLKEIKVERSPTGKDAAAPAWQAVVTLANAGKMYYRPTGKVEVLDETGKAVESVDFPSLAVLREREQRFPFPLKTALDAGHYKVRVRVDMGTGEIQQGTVEVQAGGAADY